MTASKPILNLKDYKGVLPYASELFGVYQPLLGWKSKRQRRRFALGSGQDRLAILEQLATSAVSGLTLEVERNAIKLKDFNPGKPALEVVGSRSLLVTALRQSLAEKFGSHPGAVSDAELAKALDLATVTGVLQNHVVPALNARIQAVAAKAEARVILSGPTDSASPAFSTDHARQALDYEGRLAASILQFRDGKQFEALRKLLFPEDLKQVHAGLLASASAGNPIAQFVPQPSDGLDTMDPAFDLDRVALSPIGVVHLFRQYFFELDSFLGSPVGHVWLSPGTSLELIEVSTRKVMVDKAFEQSTETTRKSEQDSTDQDELADAIKQDNQQDIKFGASVSASFAGVTASSHFDMNTTQKEARETTHKHMRTQSSKMSTEIKSSFKTSFRTVTETTDTTSKRYVIHNTSPDKLQNYELRRKMRQVVVQVQDVGSYLCWQTFVDHPGDTLELASLVHIAQPADLDSIPHPDEPVKLDPKTTPYVVEFPYETAPDSEGHEMDVVFYQGDDQEGGLNNNDKIIWERDYHLDSPGLGYTLDTKSLEIVARHSDVCAARITALSTPGKVRVSLDQVNFADQASVKLQITATWNPPAQDLTAYAKKMTEYNNARARAQREAYNKAVKERITLASKILPRPAEELREEERITIYRQLIQEMLTPKGYRPGDVSPGAVDTSVARHVLSELINSIFDVDKMLYFVAPEWWKPRLASAVQSFGGAPNPRLKPNPNPATTPVGPVSVANQVGWDQEKGVSRSHYYITEDSAVAKLGSSLGWVLQLDGDNQRNAFLNAPWVKAVMPIRPGKEQAAINWLKHVEGFDGIGSEDYYSGDGTGPDGKPLKGKRLYEVLDILAQAMAAKYQEGMTTRTYNLADPSLPHDPDSTVTATPVDRVWEHGFDPVKGGFQAQPMVDMSDPVATANFHTFDQWLEILPTDQVVPVVVDYDPRTGRLKDPVA